MKVFSSIGYHIDRFMWMMGVFFVLIAVLFIYLKSIDHQVAYNVQQRQMLKKLQLLEIRIQGFANSRFKQFNYDEINADVEAFDTTLLSLGQSMQERPSVMYKYLETAQKNFDLQRTSIERLKSYNARIINMVHYLFDLRKTIVRRSSPQKEIFDAMGESFFVLMNEFSNADMSKSDIRRLSEKFALAKPLYNGKEMEYFEQTLTILFKDIDALNTVIHEIGDDAVQNVLVQIETGLQKELKTASVKQELAAFTLFVFALLFVGVLMGGRLRMNRVNRQLLAYRFAIENGDNIVMITDTKYNITYVNDAFVRHTGYSKEEVIGKNPHILKSGLNDEDFYNDMHKALHENRQWEGEFINKHKNGTLLYEKTTISPLLDDDRLIGYLAIKLDISEYIRQQQKLQQSSAVFENTQEGILILDSKRMILSANNAFRTMSQYSQSQILSKGIEFFSFGEYGDAFYEKLWNTVEKEGGWTGKVYIRRDKEEKIPIWLSLNTVRGRDGEPMNYIAIYTDMSEVIRTQEKADFLAYHDSLTLLPNRAYFEKHIQTLFEQNARNKVAIMFMDLDRFKVINDTLGHNVGDELLKMVPNRIVEVMDHLTYFLARLGGDEFVIVMEKITHEDEAIACAKDILAKINELMKVQQHQLSISASIGISLYPEQSRDADTLIKYADSAMYSAKEKGKNTYAFYDPKLGLDAHTRLNIEQNLKMARKNKEFFVVYQPQYDLLNRRVVGAEVLLRWHNKTLGNVLPDEFIAIAEDTGMIIDIGYFIFEEGCKAFMRWRARGCPLERLSFNISSVQLRQEDFLSKIEGIMAKTGISGKQIEIELTERVLFEFSNNNLQILNRFRAMGCEVSIDDFGTGYSSMSYLKDLPIDTVKIDKAFISHLSENKHDQKVTKGIIALSKSLGYKVIAEGVETEDQERFLYENGCDVGQGYYFSKPLEEKEFVAFTKPRIRAKL